MNDLDTKFISKLVELRVIDQPSFLSLQRSFAKEHGCSFRKKDKLLLAYQTMTEKEIAKPNPDIEQILQLKNVRSQSGIAVVSVLTKPYPCPGECIFCPTELNVPKSYLPEEPAVMRAIANGYHPYRQVTSRLRALTDTGHNIDKISVRIIGGSWSYYPRSYQNWFARMLFRACNDFGAVEKLSAASLEFLQLENEMAGSRLVELSVETRQDMINPAELLRFRKLGITKVELGVQSLDDKILSKNLRGSNNEETVRATKLLKDFGFKVSYQMMLNLYCSSPELDEKMFKLLFSEEEYQPDHLKIYPLALVDNSGLYSKYLEGKFKPYDRETLLSLLIAIKRNIPKYCRIERVIRDIPAERIIEGGAAISNLRQEVEKEMAKHGELCKCIRCREIKSKQLEGNIKLEVETYPASDGTEYFISLSDGGDRLIGFCRLRCSNSRQKPSILQDAAIIREIHIYGPSSKISQRSSESHQHQGYGKQLVSRAEEISRDAGLTRLAVIAGVGVRGYFRSLGYKLRDTYMIKDL